MEWEMRGEIHVKTAPLNRHTPPYTATRHINIMEVHSTKTLLIFHHEEWSHPQQ